MGLRELCRCGRRPPRDGRCTLGENRDQCSRAIRCRALLVRQGAVIREGRNSATARHAQPVAGRSRRRISPPSWRQHLRVSVSIQRGGGLRRTIGSRSGDVAPRTLIRRIRLDAYRSPEPPNAGTEMSFTPPCSVPQNGHSSPCKMHKNCPPTRLSSLSNYLIFNVLCAMQRIRTMVPIRVFSLFSGRARSLHPPCTTFAARRNIPLCPRGNDKEGSR